MMESKVSDPNRIPYTAPDFRKRVGSWSTGETEEKLMWDEDRGIKAVQYRKGSDEDRGTTAVQHRKEIEKGLGWLRW
jgi:hypothetical protein